MIFELLPGIMTAGFMFTVLIFLLSEKNTLGGGAEIITFILLAGIFGIFIFGLSTSVIEHALEQVKISDLADSVCREMNGFIKYERIGFGEYRTYCITNNQKVELVEHDGSWIIIQGVTR